MVWYKFDTYLQHGQIFNIKITVLWLSGKIFDIVKVSEKSGNSVFWFIVHKFSSRFWNAFSFGKGEKYAAKQAKRSIRHSTPDTCVLLEVSGFRCECFLPNSFFLFPQKAQRGWKWRENYRWPAKNTKANVNMDFFLINKRSVKSQGKVREFLTFWWVATL